MEDRSAATENEEYTFSIAFEDNGGASANDAMRGAGTVTLNLTNGTLRFTGRPRRALARGTVSAIVDAAGVVNAVRAGRRIRFSASGSGAGEPRRPFAFVCESEDDAATLQSFLPRTFDEHFAAERSFARQLASLPGASHWTRSVTGILILANVAMFVVLGAVFNAGWLTTTSMEPYLRFAASNGAATTNGQWWRLITSMFSHYGLLHLALNMWALHNVGQLMERLAGRPLFALLYTTSGVAGALASILWNGDRVWSAGASGAVFGIFGATLGYILRQRHAIPRTVFQPMLKSALLFGGYNLVFGLAHSGIDNAAHIGGFLSGLLLSWLTALPLDWSERAPLLRRRFFLGIVASAALIGVGVAATPRFDYRIDEEIAWTGMLKPFAQQETSVQERLTSAVDRYLAQDPGSAMALLAVLQNESIPFHEKLVAELRRAEFTAGLKTDKRRNLVLRSLETRLQALRVLSDAVRNNDNAQIDAYRRLEQEAADQLDALER